MIQAAIWPDQWDYMTLTSPPTQDDGSTSTQSAIPVILTYLAEGAANIVYKVTMLPNDVPRNNAAIALDDTIIRVRKDKPGLLSVWEQHTYRTTEIQDIFASRYYMRQICLSVDSAILAAINRDLLGLDGQEAPRRSSSRLRDRVDESERHVMLVENMSPRNSDQIMIEFKPKWLIESPTAPRMSIRCRTCAIRAQRQQRSGHGSTRQRPWCPLTLLFGEHEILKEASDAVFANAGFGLITNEARSNTFANLVDKEVRPALDVIYGVQIVYDRRGILCFNPDRMLPSGEAQTSVRHYAEAMTFRDCSIFIRVNADLLGEVEVRVADLDKKPSDPDRVRKWQQAERKLIDEGWYTNTEQHYRPERTCLLATHGRRELRRLTTLLTARVNERTQTGYRVAAAARARDSEVTQDSMSVPVAEVQAAGTNGEADHRTDTGEPN